MLCVMPHNQMIYREPQPITRGKAEASFASGDTEDIATALVDAAFHDPDWRWVQSKCLEFAGSANGTLRRISATCLGHLARIHKQLDLEMVAPLLLKLLQDSEVYVRGSADDALADIEMYIGVNVRSK